MNGTLISHPPGGGGSGSSVTNGGPAVAKSRAKKHLATVRAPQMFNVKDVDLVLRRSLFPHQFKDAACGWIDQVCGLTFAGHDAARTFHRRHRRFEMKFSVVTDFRDC